MVVGAVPTIAYFLTQTTWWESWNSSQEAQSNSESQSKTEWSSPWTKSGDESIGE